MKTTVLSLPPIILIASDPRHQFGTWLSDGDCDCACADVRSSNQPNQTFATAINDDYLLYANDFYTQPLPSKHWLLFHPTGLGQEAVVNNSALNILRFFKSPHYATDATNFLSDYPQYQVQNTIAALLKLRLLEQSPQPTENHLGESNWLVVWQHTSNHCSLRCSYCYVSKTQDEMSSDTGKQALDTIFRTAQKHHFGGIKLKYAGGEPTQNFPLIIELNNYARLLAKHYNLQLDQVVLSNGVSITDTMIDTLKANDIRLMISLDGVGKYHDTHRKFTSGQGSFVIVSKTIERLLYQGLVPHISITLSNRNIDGLAEAITYVLERGLTFSLNLYRENDCSKSTQDLGIDEHRMIDGIEKAFNVIEQNLPRRILCGSLLDRGNLIAPHDHVCGVGKNYLVVDSNGGIAKCHMTINQPITNINAEDPLAIICNDPNGVQNLSVNEKEGCRDCDWRYWCAGGCPLATFRATGRYDTKSPNCNIYKKLFPMVLRLEGLRILKYGTAISPA